MPSGLFGRNRIAGTILVILGTAVFVRLGIWQLDRLSQRRAFNDHVRSMQALPTLEFPTTENVLAQEYRHAEIKGTFDFNAEVALRNQVYQGQYGYHLLTPLIISTNSEFAGTEPMAIVVDRGWVPATDNDQPQDWRKYDLPGAASVSGVIRLGHESAQAGLALPQQTVHSGNIDNFVLFVDLPRFQERVPYRLMPVYLQADETNARPGSPIGGSPSLDLSDGPHLGYAIQWFGFAAALCAAYVAPLVKNRTGSR